MSNYNFTVVGVTSDGTPTIRSDEVQELLRDLQTKHLTAIQAAKLEAEKEQLKQNALIMANARRLIKAKVATSNGRLYMELFGTGMGTGRERCRELGIDPDSNKTDYTTMANHIEQLQRERDEFKVHAERDKQSFKAGYGYAKEQVIKYGTLAYAVPGED